MKMQKFNEFVNEDFDLGYKPSRGEKVIYRPKTGPYLYKYPNGVTGTIESWLADGIYTFKPDNEILSISVKFNPYEEKSPFFKLDEKNPIFYTKPIFNKGDNVMYLPKSGHDLKRFPRGVEGVITEIIQKNWYTFRPKGNLEPMLNIKWGIDENPPFVKMKNDLDITSDRNKKFEPLRKYQLPLKEEPKKEEKEYIVEHPTGEIIYVTKKEKRILSDFGYIRYEAIKNIYIFRSNKRTVIEDTLEYERKIAT